MIFDVVLSTEAATRGVPLKEGVLKNFAKYTGKHMCHSLFLSFFACLRPAILLKKRLR